MLSFFRETPPSTPFEACPTFQKIRPLLSSLFAKEVELKNAAAQPGKNVLSRQKHMVISDLCENIRQFQHDFNQTSKESNADTAKSIIIFANKLGIVINEILAEEGDILGQHRDVKKRAMGRKVIDVGTHAAVIAPGAIMGSPVIAASMAVGAVTGGTSFITTPIQRGLYYATGLSHKKPKSIELLNSLALAIEEIVQNVKLESAHAVKETIDEWVSKESNFQLNSQ
ncbi:MAG: hypothetical protein KIT56_11220 [Gammaproteobacteria bacterium]|nr:hypothetical protein [Gammaproteobacteria bacterium]MCW5584416.1 hypothetical protein [Gammaproteobacteria bacterium]